MLVDERVRYYDFPFLTKLRQSNNDSNIIAKYTIE